MDKNVRRPGQEHNYNMLHDEIKGHHSMHHMGIDRTLYLVCKVNPTVSKEIVQRVVRRCVGCQSTDPAPIIHQPGELQVRTSEGWLSMSPTIEGLRI